MDVKINVLPLWTRNPPGVVISTVSKGAWKGLSPFVIGPCRLYDDYIALNMENAWQYAKVYSEHLLERQNNHGPVISTQYWNWAEAGWANPRAVRYPMGRGRRPEFSIWNSRRLDYVSARKVIYSPLYAEAVQKQDDWRQLLGLAGNSDEITLLDYDAYDHRKLGMSLTDVLNDPSRKMGHAFVLAMLLTGDPALNQMEMR